MCGACVPATTRAPASRSCTTDRAHAWRCTSISRRGTWPRWRSADAGVGRAPRWVPCKAGWARVFAPERSRGAAMRPPVPPFTEETARQKVQAAEDAWNTRDPERVAAAYTEDSQWRNRDEFLTGR